MEHKRTGQIKTLNKGHKTDSDDVVCVVCVCLCGESMDVCAVIVGCDNVELQPETTTAAIGWITAAAGVSAQCRAADLHQSAGFPSRPNGNRPARYLGWPDVQCDLSFKFINHT